MWLKETALSAPLVLLNHRHTPPLPQAKMYEAICFCNLLPEDSPVLGVGPEGNPTAFTGDNLVYV